jgi:hypothetical protein
LSKIKIVKESSFKTVPLEEYSPRIGVTINEETIQEEDRSFTVSRERFDTAELRDSSDVLDI